MAKRQPLLFSQEDLQILAQERYEHPDPRVQVRMEVLWLISQKLTHGDAARLAGVSRAARHYDTFAAFRGALDGCLSKIETEHANGLKSLMTHKFQTFQDVSFLAA